MRENFREMFGDQEGIMPYFQTVVCRDDGLPVKPDPALFLKAAENLGKSPSECLVLEDSQHGTTAAHRAGMPVISVPNLSLIHILWKKRS